jgi:hypothetical protein
LLHSLVAGQEVPVGDILCNVFLHVLLWGLFPFAQSIDLRTNPAAFGGDVGSHRDIESWSPDTPTANAAMEATAAGRNKREGCTPWSVKVPAWIACDGFLKLVHMYLHIPYVAYGSMSGSASTYMFHHIARALPGVVDVGTGKRVRIYATGIGGNGGRALVYDSEKGYSHLNSGRWNVGTKMFILIGDTNAVVRLDRATLLGQGAVNALWVATSGGAGQSAAQRFGNGNAEQMLELKAYITSSPDARPSNARQKHHVYLQRLGAYCGSGPELQQQSCARRARQHHAQWCPPTYPN